MILAAAIAEVMVDPQPARLQAGMFTSADDTWSTPESFMAVLRSEYGDFDLDPCCLPSSAKAPRYFTPDDDGLAQEWIGRVFMNPPYGRGIGAWITKARESADAGAVVVCLIPARTDTAWWHDEVMAHASQIRFVVGRLKFSGSPVNAPFPCAVVVFGLGPGRTVSAIERTLA